MMSMEDLEEARKKKEERQTKRRKKQPPVQPTVVEPIHLSDGEIELDEEDAEELLNEYIGLS